MSLFKAAIDGALAGLAGGFVRGFLIVAVCVGLGLWLVGQA